MSSSQGKAQGKGKIIKFAGIGIAAIVVAVGIYFFSIFQHYKDDVAAIQIQNVDLAAIADGTYFGDCDVRIVSAKVKVTVKNHNITEIELLEHNNGRGGAAEVVPDEVIRAQRVDVDAVSGATTSSKVILKAIADALSGSPR